MYILPVSFPSEHNDNSFYCFLYVFFFSFYFPPLFLNCLLTLHEMCLASHVPFFFCCEQVFSCIPTPT
ncbi:hypothetical protein K450DRAFT_255700 [Umbelopsis ramanniana AG]|uniref:Uncharacterized protein n=1 Tax=Umbelopsis ramanniana AG TaxID=1314678 RepID=A0AAD5E4T3_UMBRA|nr:uncharacterized protein K450DRAFT_255700 [Umbelopsis ramanniana AG]KAI8576694.1 hypothetical protein K450DRAFT_255700 [Umbelopsis ramanniana AG]